MWLCLERCDTDGIIVDSFRQDGDMTFSSKCTSVCAWVFTRDSPSLFYHAFGVLWPSPQFGDWWPRYHATWIVGPVFFDRLRSRKWRHSLAFADVSKAVHSSIVVPESQYCSNRKDLEHYSLMNPILSIVELNVQWLGLG
jgi:hypothetical protein